jgi:hypothetical protein
MIGSFLGAMLGYFALGKWVDSLPYLSSNGVVAVIYYINIRNSNFTEN